MGHGDQFKPAVVDAKNFVALKVESGNVAFYLFVVGGVAKAQVAISRYQVKQVLEDALCVTLAQ